VRPGALFDGDTMGSEARLAIGISILAQGEWKGPTTPITLMSSANERAFAAHL
jgi:hypothetical protein